VLVCPALIAKLTGVLERGEKFVTHAAEVERRRT
jgi:hypothetical protein